MSEELNAPASIDCWSCGTFMTLGERGDNDGDCPICNAEIDLEPYLAKALAGHSVRDARIVELGVELEGEREAARDGNAEYLELQSERDFLHAELAAIKAQEPVAVVHAQHGFCWYEGRKPTPGTNLYAAPVSEAKVQDFEPLVCDYCNAETQDPWHGSGMLNGVESRHIHACSQCRNLLPTAKALGVVIPEPLTAAITRADDVLHALSSWESSSVKLEQRHGPEWTKEVDAIRRELHTQLARLNATPVQQPKCQTCNDNGMIGGPSFYAPDEGGEPCPHCAAAPDAVEVLRAVQEQFNRFGERFPDGFDGRVFRWVDDAVAAYALDAPVQQVSVPDGWKLVPVEPTPEMISAGNDAAHAGGCDLYQLTREVMNAYPAMLGAAPATPAADGWIPVGERMPEPGEPVQVWCEGAEQPGLAWVSRHAGWSGEWVIPEPQAIGYESITHWMPLPSGPAANRSRRLV